MAQRIGNAALAAGVSSLLVLHALSGCGNNPAPADEDHTSGSGASHGAGGSAGSAVGSSQAGSGHGTKGEPGADGSAAQASGSGGADGADGPKAGVAGTEGSGSEAGSAGSRAGTTGTGGRGAGLGDSGAAGRSNGAGGGKAGPAGADAGKAAAAGGTTATTTTDGGSSAGDILVDFQNGVIWNDTGGKKIEAHGGGILKQGDTWYWVGEDKSSSTAWVNCYSSQDLSHWKFEKAIITRSTSKELSASGRIIERPKIVYNDSTKQYVVWLHWDGNSYGDAEAGVFTSSTACGDYTLKSHFRPNNNMSRDCSLFQDSDGKAYFMSSANENADMMIYELTDDYTDVSRQLLKLWAGAKREAPAMFKKDSLYYLITSACTGWDPNQGAYGTASSVGGTWSDRKNIGDSTTYDSQSAYVLPVVGTKTTTYIYMGDRWQDPDLPSSKYIWLPLKFSGTSMALDYYDKWQLNVTTGEWSAGGSGGTGGADSYVPQAGWKLLKADSQETQGEDGQAERAFDDSPSTFWHTQYTGTKAPYPHEIQIDLGTTYAVQGIRALPRQDDNTNGMIAKYEFYATEDASDWGTAVATGTWDSSKSAKNVTFPKMNAHYIRLVALSEVSGKEYASLAEIDLVPAK